MNVCRSQFLDFDFFLEDFCFAGCSSYGGKYTIVIQLALLFAHSKVL